MRCLVVDDERAVLAMVRACLLAAGHEPLCADGGRNAVAAWAEARPPLVITDWVMPDVDGEQLCRCIRASDKGQETYIIMLTACDTQEAINRGLGLGINDYITKPFCREELMLRVGIGIRSIELRHTLACRVSELQRALARVEKLEGLLPACSYCKRIRDHDGEWHDLHTYMETHTQTQFSHGYCPDCYARHVVPQVESFRANRLMARERSVDSPLR